MRSTPGIKRKNSTGIVLQTDRSYDGTDTDHYLQPDADTSVEQLDPTLTNPRCSNYDLGHNPKPNCKDDLSHNRLLRNACVHFSENLGMCDGTDMRKAYRFSQELSRLSTVLFEPCRLSHTIFRLCNCWELDLHHIALISSDDIRSVSVTIPENLPKFDSGYNTEYTQTLLVF